ncbi:unnamed protein product [Nesidiocoris tenuis]|uniref:C2H2-type domain-containing protein n=1 Tax=Nesidiocoris tenuis TaxID=355587 RepID=A0A6H5GM32_9HEMI|nr:unnamed protein product [Nesidiocoris tenuis]
MPFTTRSPNRFQVPYRRTKVGQKHSSYIGPHLLNRLPCEIHDGNSFLTKIKLLKEWFWTQWQDDQDHSSRDRVVILWNFDTAEQINVLPMYESVESILLLAENIFLPGYDVKFKNGIFVAIGGSNGVVRVWDVLNAKQLYEQKNSLISKADEVSKNEKRLVTGGSDSRLIFWSDVTEAKKVEKAQKQQELALKEQELANLLKDEDLLSALQLAISLEKPATVLKIVQDVMDKGDTRLSDTINKLNVPEKQELLNYVAHWNTNSKTCYPAQVLISCLLNDMIAGRLTVSRHVLESLIPYTEKHFQRLTTHLQDVHIVEYTRLLMKPIFKIEVPFRRNGVETGENRQGGRLREHVRSLLQRSADILRWPMRPSRLFRVFDPNARPVQAERMSHLSTGYANAEKKAYDSLLAHVCSECGKESPNFGHLRDHVRRVHQLNFCDLCVENLKILTIERRCYSRKDLATHRRVGDPDDRSHRGHPLCEFCDKRYMDNEELYRHMRRDHLYCHFCDADGFHYYYKTYDSLREHYRNDHFLCEEGDCYVEKFTSVFRTEIDLKVEILHERICAGGAAPAPPQTTLAPSANRKSASASVRARNHFSMDDFPALGPDGGGPRAPPIRPVSAQTSGRPAAPAPSSVMTSVTMRVNTERSGTSSAAPSQTNLSIQVSSPRFTTTVTSQNTSYNIHFPALEGDGPGPAPPPAQPKANPSSALQWTTTSKKSKKSNETQTSASQLSKMKPLPKMDDFPALEPKSSKPLFPPSAQKTSTGGGIGSGEPHKKSAAEKAYEKRALLYDGMVETEKSTIKQLDANIKMATAEEVELLRKSAAPGGKENQSQPNNQPVEVSDDSAFPALPGFGPPPPGFAPKWEVKKNPSGRPAQKAKAPPPGLGSTRPPPGLEPVAVVPPPGLEPVAAPNPPPGFTPANGAFPPLVTGGTFINPPNSDARNTALIGKV